MPFSRVSPSRMQRWDVAMFALSLAAACSWNEIARAESVEHLADLSLRELSDLEVTSVSKSAELLRRAPASIYVITHDEIIRSGATSLVEALRLAPNLQISQYTNTHYVAAARGLGGAEELQNFSNKLLILIDGRSVYSPLYSGVYLDVQDVMLEDIDRIEVISGPGATLWGANAMNGVINIITRPAYLTDESFASVGAGNLERSVAGRYGSKISDALAMRVYAKAFERDAMELQDGSSAQDDWYKGQAGFRLDWSDADDTYTTQGDAYSGSEGRLGIDDERVAGANVLGRWQHQGATSDWQVQAYYDYTHREQPNGGNAFDLHTLDIELQQNFISGVQRIIWGAGARANRFRITNSAALTFDPSDRTLTLGNLFLQDTIRLADPLDLTIGLKAEHDSYSGWNLLPDIRLSWRIGERAMSWVSASRAIRSPTPFDVDVIEKAPDGTVFLVGNSDFQPEAVNAFEMGLRMQPAASFSLSASMFYDDYDDLRTIETNPATGLLPLSWGNRMDGYTYGVEAWAKWQVTSGWRLAPGVRWVEKHLKFDASASGLGGLNQSGNDPKYQVLLTSSADLRANLTLDATLRYVDELPDPALDSYYELSASLAWRATSNLNLSVSGQNLLNHRHIEYPATSGEYIRRGILALARWTF